MSINDLFAFVVRCVSRLLFINSRIFLSHLIKKLLFSINRRFVVVIDFRSIKTTIKSHQV